MLEQLQRLVSEALAALESVSDEEPLYAWNR